MRKSKLLAEALACAVVLLAIAAQAVLASGAYTVRKGDTYWSVAHKFGLSQYALVYANKALGNKPLQIGQRITIPSKSFKVPAHKAQVIGASVRVRNQPAVGSASSGSVGSGEVVWVVAMAKGWCKVKTSGGKSGWVAGDFVSPAIDQSLIARTRVASARTQTPARKQSSAARPQEPATPEAPCAAVESSNGGVVQTALAFRGTRYSYGGTSRGGFDCSGFTRYVYAQHGVRLPHNSRAQAGIGTSVSRSELKEGDLVFFHTTRRGISHVGIYAGNGKFVHASSSGRGVRVDSLGDGYYARRLVGARRVK